MVDLRGVEQSNGQVGGHFDDVDESGRVNPLTGIPRAYALVAAQESDGEVESLMVRQFLVTLAEVALAVASRTVKR